MAGPREDIVVDIGWVPDDLEPLEGFGRMIRKLRELDVPPRTRVPSPAKIAKTAKETGQRIEITRRPDGSWTYAANPLERAKEAAPVEEPPRASLFKARLVPKQKVVL